MNADDDDELDDASLKSMRAVWLSMRDEEPPAAGMSSLLAAARAQAEQMREPPAWHERLFALLRRPPALAFATVLILIGGAVLVTRSSNEPVDSLTADGPAAPRSAPASELAPADPASATPVGAGELADDGQEAGRDDGRDDRDREVQRSPAGASAAGAPAQDLENESIRRRAGAKSETKPPARRPVKQKQPSRADQYREEAAALEDSSKPRAQSSASRGETSGTTLESPAGGASRSPSPSPPPPPPPPASPRPTADRADDPAAPAPSPATGAPQQEQVSLEQLARQAAQAAARGDCAAVRTIAARIKQEDARFYRARIESQAAIAKCL